MKRAVPISWFDLPSTSSRTTSISRLERSPAAGDEATAVEEAGTSIGEVLSRWSTDGPLVHDLVPLLVVKRDGPPAFPVQPLHGVDEVSVEGVAAHLAIGDDVETRGLLECQRVVDGAILDSLELRRSDRAVSALCASGLEPCRSEQAADDVGPVRRRACR